MAIGLLDEKIENVSFEEAKELAKKKELNVTKITRIKEPVDRYTFFDRYNSVIARYYPKERNFLYSLSPKYKYDTPGFQEFTQNLIKRRFPDRPGLLSTVIRRIEMPIDAAAFSGGAQDFGADIIVDNRYKTNDINTKYDLNYILTHELTHVRRALDGEEKTEPEDDKEEIETELEALQRGTIIDSRYTSNYAGYWNMLGPIWPVKQKQDYRTLTRREVPRDYDVLEKPITHRIVGNINTKKKATNLWDLIRSGELKEKIVVEEEIARKDEHEYRGKRKYLRRFKKSKNPENIDTSYVTSEGDKYHFFSPSGRAKPRKIAKFIDGADGIMGEEDVWQIMDIGKRLLISDKGTPDRVVKKQKYYKKKKLKKNLMSDILAFKFF